MIGVRDTELGDCQRAARVLLVHGVVTPALPGAAEWRNVRRFAEPLDAALYELAGYRVVRSRDVVQLVRRVDGLTTAPIFMTPSGRDFDKIRYALLVLALAALDRSGSQITLTDLARRIRRSTDAIAALPFDPVDHSSRLALSHAVRALEQRGVLRLTDGSREAWEQGRDEAEALYDIHRQVGRALFPLPRGLRDCGGASGLLRHERGSVGSVGRDEARRARRQHLTRRLLEQPVLYFADLDEAERSYLQREAGRLADRLDELTGAALERREEGLALVDPGRRFSDRPFPSGGGNQQAALLLAARICQRVNALPQETAPHVRDRSDQLAAALDAAAPAETSPAPTTAQPRPRTSGPFVDTLTLKELAGALCQALQPALKVAHRDPAVFLADALEVLEAHDCLRAVPGGVVAMPALARFREPQVEAPAELKAQLALFGGGDGG